MGDLFWNKVAGAVLAILLIILGLRTFGEGLFGHEELDPETLAYPIDLSVLDVAGASEEEEEGPVDYGALLAAADVSAGARVANRCASCHTFEEGGADGTGPHLWGVIGRQVAAVDGFNYSSAMEEYGSGGTAWMFENMDNFLANPRGYINGTAMSFAGLRDQEDRMNLIAYMRTLANDPVPLPEPLPEEEPAEEVPGDEIVDAEVETDINSPSEAVAETNELDQEDAVLENADEDAAQDETSLEDDASEEPNEG